MQAAPRPKSCARSKPPTTAGPCPTARTIGPAASRPGSRRYSRESHINVDECGAPEFYTGGAKLIALSGEHGKIAPEVLAAAIKDVGNVHAVQPAAVSLTNASEAGTVYTPDETRAISALAKDHGLGLHMDGARFANAITSLGCSPAELTWKAGVDALSLGATKNGVMAGELVVIFDPGPGQAERLGYLRKRGGHLFSKMRFLSAQLEAYLADDLWLRNARHANAMAAALAEGLVELPGAELSHPVEANEIFVTLPEPVIQGLFERGFEFYRWGAEENQEARLVLAFNTDPAHIEAFLSAARELA
ncbi:MAG: threonine aldolase family protein [Alphaproteobacteria bacterium]